MPEKHPRPYPESHEPSLVALAALGLIAAGVYPLIGIASAFLARLAELPERLAPGGGWGF